MHRAYVSLGSNVEPARHLRAALQTLAKRFGPLALSPVYESPAFGFKGANFLNLVVGFDTDEPAGAVSEALKAIEAGQGRVRTGPRYADRTLDLDLILYGDAVLSEGPLRLPRPEILEHAHVLCPLADLAGDALHPLLRRRYRDLWGEFDGATQPLWPVPFDPETAA
jgi:2-amino-4-hydroxy-6-hydroxymethyldihydropteridine diphosphokinase